eukprot:3825901-Lingulodinium_polyedra.AAC.1
MAPLPRAYFRAVQAQAAWRELPVHAYGCVPGRPREEAVMKAAGCSHMNNYYDMANAFASGTFPNQDVTVDARHTDEKAWIIKYT